MMGAINNSKYFWLLNSCPKKLMMYYVYLLTNTRHSVFYTGVTNDLEQRVFDHKAKNNKGFTAKYNCTGLVFFEEFDEIVEAIHREKQLKRYHRKWKRELVSDLNPEWKDLSEGWYDKREFELNAKLKHEEQNRSRNN
jgi:putative endonuclease